MHQRPRTGDIVPLSCSIQFRIDRIPSASGRYQKRRRGQRGTRPGHLRASQLLSQRMGCGQRPGGCPTVLWDGREPGRYRRYDWGCMVLSRGVRGEEGQGKRSYFLGLERGLLNQPDGSHFRASMLWIQHHFGISNARQYRRTLVLIQDLVHSRQVLSTGWKERK